MILQRVCNKISFNSKNYICFTYSLCSIIKMQIPTLLGGGIHCPSSMLPRRRLEVG